MSVLHLTHARSWRGGENQIRLLLEHLPPQWRGRLGAPPGSEVERRLSQSVPFDPARCGGLADPASVFKVRALVRQHGVTLIHAHDSQSQMTAALATVVTGVPVVASKRNAFAAKGGWKYRRTRHFIAVSQAAADRLVAGGVERSKISVIHDAIDLAELDGARPERPEAGEGDCVVLCPAAFSKEKDHATLLKAWAEVEKTAPSALLHLAGAGPLETEMRGFAESLGLKRARFLGWRNDLPALITGADIVTLSSTMEGLGSSLCEAQGAGKPVVATRAGGIPEAVADGETGLLSAPGDAAALAANLLRLIADRDLRQNFGTQARERARRLFAPETIAAQHADVYARVLAG